MYQAEWQDINFPRVMGLTFLHLNFSTEEDDSAAIQNGPLVRRKQIQRKKNRT